MKKQCSKCKKVFTQIPSEARVSINFDCFDGWYWECCKSTIFLAWNEGIGTLSGNDPVSILHRNNTLQTMHDIDSHIQGKMENNTLAHEDFDPGISERKGVVVAIRKTPRIRS